PLRNAHPSSPRPALCGGAVAGLGGDAVAADRADGQAASGRGVLERAARALAPLLSVAAPAVERQHLMPERLRLQALPGPPADDPEAAAGKALVRPRGTGALAGAVVG